MPGLMTGEKHKEKGEKTKRRKHYSNRFLFLTSSNKVLCAIKTVLG
jgi:hypothetical protein